MTVFLQALQAGRISFPFNYPSFFSKPDVAHCKSKPERSFIEAECIGAEFSLNKQIVEQWEYVKTVLKKDTWYREQGLSGEEEARFATVLSSFANACEPLVRWAGREKSIECGVPSSPDYPEATSVSQPQNGEIEAGLTYLHKVMVGFNTCYLAFKVEPETQKKMDFLFCFSLILILSPVIAPIFAHIGAVLAISPAMTTLFGECFVYVSVAVQLFRLFSAYIQDNRQVHLNKHKKLFKQFSEQLEKYSREKMNATTAHIRIDAVSQQLRELTQKFAALEAKKSTDAAFNKDDLALALVDSGLPPEKADIVFQSMTQRANARHAAGNALDAAGHQA